MDLTGSMTYVATLSVATERVTEFIKRVPKLSEYLSAKLPPGRKEDVRVIVVHLLATIIGTTVCYVFPQLAPSDLLTKTPSGPVLEFHWCILFGLLASGGSAFWNSALDTFRGVKTKMEAPQGALPGSTGTAH